MRMRVGAASQLVAVAMAAAAPGGGGTGSTRSWEIRAVFERVPGSTTKFKGPQGGQLADFINYASADGNITDANWHSFGKQAISKLGRQHINVQAHHDRYCRYSISERSNRTIR